MFLALTEREVKVARTAAKPYKLADGGNMHLLVTPTGGKLWRWAYRYRGKARLMALGKYPDVSLARARVLHAEARTLLAAGTDPMAARKDARLAVRGNSFEEIAARWLAHWRVGKTERHGDVTERRLKANIYPHIGARPIAEIEAQHLVAMMLAIEGRGVSDLAKRSLQTVGQVFRFAIARGLAKRNPAAEIRPRDVLQQTRKTNLARVDAKDLPDLLAAIDLYPGTHVTRLAMKLLALTFVRTTELIAAPWSEFDLEGKRWEIPAERMKMRTPHIVPLSEQAVGVLRLLRRLTGSGPMLFPGARKGTMSNMTILQGLARIGYKHRMTGHGFRGLASTILHEQGFLHDHIELQLAHTPRNAVSAAYNHALYLEPRAKMMQAWADYLDATLAKGKAES